MDVYEGFSIEDISPQHSVLQTNIATKYGIILGLKLSSVIKPYETLSQYLALKTKEL